MAITGTYFSSSYYLTQYSDVAANWAGSALDHYTQYGASENRAPNSWFNAQYYRANNSDLSSMTAVQLFEHYETYGYAEGRTTSSTYANFNEALYISTYSDLGTAGITALTALNHYLMYGAGEGRVAKNDDGTTISGTTTTTGTTYTLTTATDNLTGTSGNDTFIGDFTATATANAADQINGGAGTDTIKLYGTYAAGNVPVSMTSIETFELVSALAAANHDFSAFAKAATGISTFVLDSAAALTGNTITTTAGQSLSLATAAGAVTAGTVTWAASATDTSANLILNGYQYVSGGVPAALTVTGAATTTMNISSTGNTNKIGTFTGPTTVTSHVITGDKAFTYALAAADVAALNSINASTDTGGVTADVSAASTKIGFTFTGGTGNDTLTIAAGQLATAALTSGTQFAFGDGTDTLVIKDTTPVYSVINVMTGLETVQAGVTATTFDMAQLTAAKVAFGTVAVGTVSNLESTDTVTMTGAMATSLTVGGAVGNSTGTINMGAATTAGFTVASLVTTGLTTVNLSSNGVGAVTNVITAITNSDNTNFVLTGSKALTMTVTAAATVTGDKIDGTNFTGVLTATGSDLADIIIGGSAADVLTGGKGADTITGGAGADTFAFSGAAGATTSGAVWGNFDTITDFVIGTDKLQFTGFVDVVSAQQAAVQTAVTALASTATAAQIATAMATASTTNLGVSFAVFGGNTYVLAETTGASTGVVADDVFIKLAGVTTAPTFAADVIA